jgi:hypothetical protein
MRSIGFQPPGSDSEFRRPRLHPRLIARAESEMPVVTRSSKNPEADANGRPDSRRRSNRSREIRKLPTSEPFAPRSPPRRTRAHQKNYTAKVAGSSGKACKNALKTQKSGAIRKSGRPPKHDQLALLAAYFCIRDMRIVDGKSSCRLTLKSVCELVNRDEYRQGSGALCPSTLRKRVEKLLNTKYLYLCKSDLPKVRDLAVKYNVTLPDDGISAAGTIDVPDEDVENEHIDVKEHIQNMPALPSQMEQGIHHSLVTDIYQHTWLGEVKLEDPYDSSPELHWAFVQGHVECGPANVYNEYKQKFEETDGGNFQPDIKEAQDIDMDDAPLVTTGIALSSYLD